jgi:hypothetical protein
MRFARIATVLIGSSAALTLAACAATTNGQGGRDTGGAPSGSVSASVSVAPSASGSANSMPTDAKGLYTLMAGSLDSVTSTHLAMTIASGGENLAITGDEKLKHGKVTAMKFDETLPGGAGSIEIILAGGKIYAKVPSSLNTTGKPYLLITETSKNAQVRQLAKSINSSLTTASVGGYAVFAQAADSLKLVGTETRNGTHVAHYTMVMNPSKLPPDYPNKQELVDSGVGTIPVELYVDSHGRPAEMGEHFTFSGQTIDTKATFTRYNQPVDISAPPASEVGAE